MVEVTVRNVIIQPKTCDMARLKSDVCMRASIEK